MSAEQIRQHIAKHHKVDALDSLIASVKTIVGKNWDVTRAFGLGLLGGSTPEFVMLTPPPMPDDCRYHGKREGAEQRRENRKRWHSEGIVQADAAERQLEALLSATCNIRRDGAQIIIRPKYKS